METVSGPGSSALELQHHGEQRSAGALGAARWEPRKHYLLIVIGDIGSDSQLRAVRGHLEHGESGAGIRSKCAVQQERKQGVQ
ncbi:hypothetical protein NDU88_005435 [Pleurodeles waltl]|uniref:Uncharacterized protein n=1 Tax=Pleurodeles waltl TaxID=8319 RepID=A0AAV7TUC0_PLEWA|nr:hypothetical protein NDU88_005435 [Pleurodeles waltl]